MYFPFTTRKTIFVLLFLSVFLLHYPVSAGQQTAQRAWIGLTDPNDVYNETVVEFLEDATDTIDAQYDARKLGGNPDFDIYSKIGSDNFKVQALPWLTGDKTVTLGIDAVVAGTYRLRLTDAENMDESAVIVLEDRQNGTLQNLRSNAIYVFTLAAGTDIQRFRLRFYPPFDFTATDITCAGNPGALQLSQPGSHVWDYVVKDEGDAVIDAGTSWSGTKTLNNLNQGTYTVKLVDNYGYDLVKQVAIAAKAAVVAQFEASDTEAEVGKPVDFFDYSIGASNLRWNFGDGNIVTGTAAPTHSFAQAGDYVVTCTASNSDCADVMSKTITVSSHTTGVSAPEEDFVKVYSYGNEVMIQFSKPQYRFADVQIFNLLGQKMIDESVVTIGERQFEINDHGYFLVKVTLGQQSIEKKVYIQSH